MRNRTPGSRTQGLFRPPLLLATLTVSALLALVQGASAHETWMLATTPIGAKGDLSLSLTSGMTFPADDHPIERERVTEARWRQGKRSGTVSVGKRGEHALVLDARLPTSGATTVAVILPPKALELDAESVEEYLADLGEPAGVRDRHARQGKWREHYRKSVKAIVAGAGTAADTGSTRTGDDVSQPMGLPLELVPTRASAQVHVGEKLELVLLANGKALPGLRVGLHATGVAPRFEVTDGAGKVSFRLLHSGPTMLHATELRAVDAVDREWESDFATLTLEVSHAPAH